MFSALNSIGDFTTEEIVKLISTNPRSIFAVDLKGIEEGINANLTLFSTEMDWTVNSSELASKSKNSPFIEKTLKGKAIGVVNKGFLSIFE